MISDTAARDAYQHRLGWRINTHLREERAMPDPSDLPYSDADVKLVVSALQVRCAFCRSLPRTCPGHEGEARAVLRALAGRLLPEGAETRTLHNVAFRGGGERFIVDDALGTLAPEGHDEWEETKRLLGADCYRVTREVTTFPDGSRLVHPWSAVPPEPKEDADA